jgi:hypothetical protein
MSRIGIYLLLLAIWVQSATLLSQRECVADPVELAHFKVIDDVEVEKPTGRFTFDPAADFSTGSLATVGFSCYAFRCHVSCCRAFRADAHFQRGPPSLI